MKEYMKEISVKEAIGSADVDTLCWDCEKAMRGGCCWTDPEHQKPVEGWTAEESTNGCRVIECPEFIRSTYGGGRYRTSDDYILALEIKVSDLERQIHNLKKTIWWKHVYRLRREKKELQIRIKRLGEVLELMKNGGESNGTQA